MSFRNTCVNNVNVSTNVPPMNKYEIMIGASRKGGDIVSDGRGYTYSFQLDYPNLRVWMCTFRGCDKYPRWWTVYDLRINIKLYNTLCL